MASRITRKRACRYYNRARDVEKAMIERISRKERRERLAEFKKGTVRQAWQGSARLGKARKGSERLGKASQGKARYFFRRYSFVRG